MRDGATTLWGVNSSNLSTPDRQTFIERHLILRQQGRSWSARHPGGKAPGWDRVRPVKADTPVNGKTAAFTNLWGLPRGRAIGKAKFL